jgi:two-component system, OmpR family, sensor histidine kinase ArlS
VKINLFRKARISVKLTILYAIVFSLILLILNASVLCGIRYYLYFQGYKQVDDVKAVILNNLNSKNENLDLSNKEIMSDIPPRENIFIRIIGENKKVINISDRYLYDVKTSGPLNKIVKYEGQDKHIIYENIKYSSNKNGIVYIQFVKDLENEYNFLKILFYLMAIADFIGMAISILAGYIVSKKMLKPIDNITRTAQSISIKNLKERIEVKGPEYELKRLSDTFNDMIDRLQSSFDKQIQFVSDASHELRTPIAVIEGYTNLILRWGKDDKVALEKSVKAIEIETKAMANLVEGLLFLAKGDTDLQRINKTEFWLNDLVSELVKESKLIAPEFHIYSAKNDAVKVVADYQMIKQMLRIFIDNSIKFSVNDRDIDISSILNKKNVCITIKDKGIGMPKEELTKIFDRFYCIEKSRSKDMSGSGLGLSIAKWIADAHNGSILVESDEGKGTRISIFLNLQP